MISGGGGGGINSMDNKKTELPMSASYLSMKWSVSYTKGLFPFKGFGSPDGRTEQNSYALLQKTHKLGGFVPGPQT